MLPGYSIADMTLCLIEVLLDDAGLPAVDCEVGPDRSPFSFPHESPPEDMLAPPASAVEFPDV